MIEIEDKLISLDIFERKFVCDLNACKGACCIDGDSGAPLVPSEANILNDISDTDTVLFNLAETYSTYHENRIVQR